jgi:hypothetical protein
MASRGLCGCTRSAVCVGSGLLLLLGLNVAPLANAFEPFFRKEPAPLSSVTPSEQPYDHPPSFKPYAQPNYLPYLNLWHLEERQVVRSPMVLSPDKTMMAYTEVVFTPATRQTVSTLYRVVLSNPVALLSLPTASLNNAGEAVVVVTPPLPNATVPRTGSVLKPIKTGVGTVVSATTWLPRMQYRIARKGVAALKTTLGKPAGPIIASPPLAKTTLPITGQATAGFKSAVSPIGTPPLPKATLPASRNALESVKSTVHWPGSIPKPSKKQLALAQAVALSAKQRANKALWDPFDPNKSLGKREQVIRIGWQRTHPHEFKTLTIIDYTPSGQQLLVWQRNGVSHLGLTPSTIWVYNRATGLSKQYPQLNQALLAQFKALGDPLPEDDIGNNAPQDLRTWDIEPLGWLAGSETVIAIQVWEYLKTIPDGSVIGSEKSTRRFKGVWAFDSASQQLTSVRPTGPWPTVSLPFIPAGLSVE